MKGDNIMNTYTLTKAELVKAQRNLDELKTIAHETQLLVEQQPEKFALLEIIWDTCDSIEQLTECYKRSLDCLIGTDETSHDIFIIGEFAYTYQDTSGKYPQTKEVYKQSALSYFRALAQAIAYQEYNIIDDLRRVQAQERADHIQYLLDIGCTEQELIRAGLLDICVPFSACPKSVTMLAYGEGE